MIIRFLLFGFAFVFLVCVSKLRVENYSTATFGLLGQLNCLGKIVENIHSKTFSIYIIKDQFCYLALIGIKRRRLSITRCDFSDLNPSDYYLNLIIVYKVATHKGVSHNFIWKLLKVNLLHFTVIVIKNSFSKFRFPVINFLVYFKLFDPLNSKRIIYFIVCLSNF